MDSEFLTLDEAATQMRYSVRHIQDLIREGVLAAHTNGKGVRVVRESIEQLKAEAIRKAEARRAALAAKRQRKGRRS